MVDIEKVEKGVAILWSVRLCEYSVVGTVYVV